MHVHEEDTLSIGLSVERHEPEKDDKDAKYIRGKPHQPHATSSSVHYKVHVLNNEMHVTSKYRE